MQLTRMQDKRGALKHDDRIDILASAVRHWSHEMVVDQDRLVNRNKEQEHKNMIKDWMGNNRIQLLMGDRYYGQGGKQGRERQSIVNNFYRR